MGFILQKKQYVLAAYCQCNIRTLPHLPCEEAGGGGDVDALYETAAAELGGEEDAEVAAVDTGQLLLKS